MARPADLAADQVHDISVFWLGGGVVVGLILTPYRRVLMRPGPWRAQADSPGDARRLQRVASFAGLNELMARDVPSSIQGGDWCARRRRRRCRAHEFGTRPCMGSLAPEIGGSVIDRFAVCRSRDAAE